MVSMIRISTVDGRVGSVGTCSTRGNPRGLRFAARCSVSVCAVIACILPGCHKPAPTPPPEEKPEVLRPSAADQHATVPGEIPTRVDIAGATDDLDRWLTVEKVKGDAPGAWATGSFDAKRNKVAIRLHDVEQFAIDVSRIPIRWDRLVIIAIDGKNSELVRRDHSILRFVNDEHGWHVVEP